MISSRKLYTLFKISEMYARLIFILIIAFCIPFANDGRRRASSDDRSQNGKDKLAELQTYTRHSNYGLCWSAALESVENDCQNLTDSLKKTMYLVECIFSTTGRPGESFGVKEMLDEVSKAYHVFYAHVENICFYLQSLQASETKTEEMPDDLMVDGKEFQKVEKQDDSAQTQQHLHKENKTLLDSHILVSEQLSKIISLIKILMSIVKDEFVGFHSWIIYGVAVGLAYMVTSVPYTSAARILLISIITLSFTAEWITVKWFDINGLMDPGAGRSASADENVICLFLLFIQFVARIWIVY